MENGRYLYAIVGADEPDGLRFEGLGINQGDVYTLAAGKISAVVSNVPNKKIRPERRHLAAHHGVLKRLMEITTPLPMVFGIVADNGSAVKKILSKNRGEFLEHILRLEGKVEMGLKVAWDVPNIFDYFVMTHPQLKELRDRFFGSHHNPSQEQKIEIGRTFERLLNEDRETYTQQVTDLLSEYCVEIKANKTGRESEVMNLACLVDRQGMKRFEEGIFEAANHFDNNFAFDYNGPWAPHNFVNIDLKI
jgi:hypothetical protein